MTALDKGGAENLPEIPGRGIYKNVSQNIIQTPYIPNRLIDELIQPFIIDKGGQIKNESKRKTRKNLVEFKETGLS
jgi:S-DNA-T family DNA segregation ATPase FtsK/SpoIIIE